MNKLSIIVPTYKEPECLDLCLGSAIQGCNNLNNIEMAVQLTKIKCKIINNFFFILLYLLSYTFCRKKYLL